MPYTLKPKPPKVGLEEIYASRIAPEVLAAFSSLAAQQGLSVQAALTQLLREHAQVRRPFAERERFQKRVGQRYTAMLPECWVEPHVAMALLIDGNRAGIKKAEAVRQLVTRCLAASP
jgi:hypothetical protein